MLILIFHYPWHSCEFSAKHAKFAYWHWHFYSKCGTHNWNVTSLTLAFGFKYYCAIVSQKCIVTFSFFYLTCSCNVSSQLTVLLCTCKLNLIWKMYLKVTLKSELSVCIPWKYTDDCIFKVTCLNVQESHLYPYLPQHTSTFDWFTCCFLSIFTLLPPSTIPFQLSVSPIPPLLQPAWHLLLPLSTSATPLTSWRCE